MNDLNRTGTSFLDVARVATKPELSKLLTAPSVAFAAALRDADDRSRSVPRQIDPQIIATEPRRPHAGLENGLKFKGPAGGEMSLHERALGLRAYRQELIASNIANADTPGYKAVDFDFADALKKNYSEKAVPLKFDTSAQGSIDGNTVNMDTERAKFAENALMYEFEIGKVGDKMMMDLLKNLPY